MQSKTWKRRTVGVGAVGLLIGSSGLVQSTDVLEESELADSDETVTILEGTEHETTVTITASGTAGLTVMVVGGIHGNEPAGWMAANVIDDWEIEAGTRITLPEANRTAIERGTRQGSDGTDLNRQFPTNEEPRTELARAIWDVVESYQPDVLIDLHESTGIYAGDPVDGVDQASFHSSGAEASEAADRAIDYVNEHYIEDPELAFMSGGLSGPDTDQEGLLVHKASRETDAMAFLVETLRTDIALETRIRWHQVVVQQLTTEWLAVDEDVVHIIDVDDEASDEPEPIDEDSAESIDGEPPTGRIRTEPEDADEITLALEETVALDATDSSPGTADIETYEWDVGNQESFDETGETLEVTVTACGEFPITLRVTDAEGRSDTEEIILSTD